MENRLVQGSSRLQAYADAIFSIVATVMILPIAHTEFPEDTALEDMLMLYILPKLVVYTGCFFLICGTWSKHVQLFQVIEKVDEMTILFNIGLMLLITFYPFTFILMANFSQTPFAIQLFCGTAVLVGCVQLLHVIYAFQNWTLLAPNIQNHTRRKALRNQMLLEIITPVILASAAAITSTFSVVVADVFLLMILFGNTLRRQFVRLQQAISRCFCRPELQLSVELEEPYYMQLMSRKISKERLECFSDGVFAIVATLIILDICEKNVPSPHDVKEMGSLTTALGEFDEVFLAYAATFSTVGLLWYVHHSLIHQVKELNLLMTLFNNLCLLCVGVMPLAFKLVTRFEEPEHENYRYANLSIQFICATVFLAGISQCAVWVTALFYQRKYLYEESHYGSPEHYYITAKLLVCPISSLIVYLVSLGPSITISVAFFNGLQLSWLGVFMALQAVYHLYYKFSWFNSRTHSQEDTDVTHSAVI